MTPPKYHPNQRCGAPGCGGCRFGEHRFKDNACPTGWRSGAVPIYHGTRVFEPLASAQIRCSCYTDGVNSDCKLHGTWPASAKGQS